jgi:hypothetical protein
MSVTVALLKLKSDIFLASWAEKNAENLNN